MSPDPLHVTGRLARALGIDPDLRRLAAWLEALEPSFVEWSVNLPTTARGALRVSLWTQDPARVSGQLDAGGLEATLHASLSRRAEPGATVGIGLAFGAGQTLRRYWRLAPVARGQGLYSDVMAALPQLAWPARGLAATCHPFRCTAVGLETGPSSLSRASVYFSVPDEAALAALAEAGVTGPSGEAQPGEPSWKDLLHLGTAPDEGLGAPSPRRPWPKLWIAASVASDHTPDVAHKLYRFMRGDRGRPPDAPVLALAGAPPALAEEVGALAAETGGPWVQLVALRSDAGARGPGALATLYLAAR